MQSLELNSLKVLTEKDSVVATAEKKFHDTILTTMDNWYRFELNLHTGQFTQPYDVTCKVL